jgi:hypothetical protein
MSDTIEFNFVNIYLGLYVRPSFRPVGFMNAPCVDGVDTKSQHNSSKSSSTSTLPSPNCETEPIPRDEIPTVMLFLNSSFNMFPDGVVNISILPSKSFPSHHNCLMLCDAFFRLITDDSGWSNSPNALFSAIGPDHIFVYFTL